MPNTRSTSFTDVIRCEGVDQLSEARLIFQQRCDVVNRIPGLGKSGTVRTRAFKGSQLIRFEFCILSSYQAPSITNGPSFCIFSSSASGPGSRVASTRLPREPFRKALFRARLYLILGPRRDHLNVSCIGLRTYPRWGSTRAAS